MSNNSLSQTTPPKWDYDAPTYVDFTKIGLGLDETFADAEDYFNYDHEENIALSVTNESEIQSDIARVAHIPDSTTTDKSDHEQSLLMTEEAKDVVNSPKYRGRCRTVLEVNNERKRLSMSVDRGRKKLMNLLRDRSTEKHRNPSSAKKLVLSMSNQQMSSRQEVVSLKEKVKVIEDAGEENANVADVVPHTGIRLHKRTPSMKPTDVKPFSFEKRNKDLLLKREEFVKKAIEEENKARRFKAQPFPDIIFKKSNKAIGTTAGYSGVTSNMPHHLQVQMKAFGKQTSSIQLNQPENKMKFRAKPATVLQKNPFKPIKAQHNPIEQVGFTLSTQQRAEKRVEWERFVKQKEHEKEEQRKLVEQKKMLEEANEIKKIRARAVHKPLPLPHLKQSTELLNSSIGSTGKENKSSGNENKSSNSNLINNNKPNTKNNEKSISTIIHKRSKSLLAHGQI